MINNLNCGIFSFLEYFIKPLWGVVILIFIAILIVLSKTIISEAKKKQKGLKQNKKRSEFYREIEPYSEMPSIIKTFDGREPNYIKPIEEDIEYPLEEIIGKPKKAVKKVAPKENIIDITEDSKDKKVIKKVKKS